MWHKPMAKASDVSNGFGGSSIFKIFCTIYWTCFLSAAPFPTTDCFTFLGAYSMDGIPFEAADNNNTPLACPNIKADFTFLLKNVSSIAMMCGSNFSNNSFMWLFRYSNRLGNDSLTGGLMVP